MKLTRRDKKLQIPSQVPADLLERIESCGVIAVIVIDDPADSVPTAHALLAGGVDVMEITLRTPKAIDAIRLARENVPEMITGVGTVLCTDQVDQAVTAGAQFAVSPGLNASVVQHAQSRQLPFIPGVMTPSDFERAAELGCRQLKFFPAEASGGAAFLHSAAAPYSHLGLQFIPLGGIHRENLGGYFQLSNVPAVGGSWLATRSLIAARDWDTITANASAAKQIIDEAKHS